VKHIELLALEIKHLKKYFWNSDKLRAMSKVVDAINKHRSNKWTYKWPCGISLGHERLGQDFVQDILKMSYDYYSTRSEHSWTKRIWYECENWTWIPLEHNNGLYDPRLSNIYMPEQRFDIPINRSWSNYEFKLNGETYKGELCLKGTIDLITEVDDHLEVVDWKGLALETPIPTSAGWSTMEEVEVGDTVFDQYGNQVEIIGKSKVKYLQSYEVLFDDNTRVICDCEHLWQLNDGSTVGVLDLKEDDEINIPKKLDSDDYDLLIDFKNNASHKKDSSLSIRKIKNVAYVGMRHTQCIMVSGETNTYLCTKNFIPTHNTGQRKNWATGEIKTYEKLQEDKQLMFYYYALDKLLPDKEVMMTIYFIRDGGPYSLCFDKSTVAEMEEFLEERYTEMWKDQLPKLCDPNHKDKKCSWCSYSKKCFEGDDMNMCHRIHESLKEQGMQKTIEQYKDSKFILGTYQAPGDA